MLVIKLQGGLGNQLFLYGLYEQLKYIGRSVKIDDESGYLYDRFRKPVLNYLGVSYEKATRRDVQILQDAQTDFYHILRRKLFGRSNREYKEPLDGSYDSNLFSLKDAYIVGYFQSDKYFPNKIVRQLLCERILHKKEWFLNDKCSQSWMSYLADASSVSLHVRRGDYLLPGYRDIYDGICSPLYYERAISQMKEIVPGAHFFIFSDDPDWCCQHFKEDETMAVVRIEGNDADIKEFFLMQSCTHHILANSSFSWWAAWLSDSSERSVCIAPRKWLNDKEMKDIYTERMLRL